MPYVLAAMTAFDLAGNYFAAENIKETAALNKDIADMNAEFAELDAYDAELDGVSEEARYQVMVDQTLADQRLAFAVQDIDVSFGTAADQVSEARFMSELNKMEIEKHAQDVAAGFETQARQFRMGGAMQAAQGEQRAADTIFRGISGAAKTVIGGASRTGATGYKQYLD